MNFTHQLLASALAATALTAAAPSQAVIIVDEDFEGIASITDGAFDENDNGSLDTAGDPFGLGSSNTYVRQDDGSTSSGGIVGISDAVGSLDNGVFSVNFLFNEPTVANRNEGISFRVGENNDSSNVNVDIGFNNGTINPSQVTGITNAYMLDTTYGFDVVVNDSASLVNYDSETLPSKTYDIYLTDLAGVTTLLFDDVPFRNLGGSDEDLDSVFFQTFGSARQQFTYDNFIVTDDEAIVRGISSIPEPASLVLALAGFGCLAARRR